MTLVAVVNLCLDAQFLEHEDTANAQHVFLLDAVLPVATIELVGDRAVKVAVLVDVGVEQVQFHASHVHLPDVGIHHASRIRHLEHHLLSVLVNHWFNWQVVEVLWLIVGDLLSVHRERLSEISITIQETHCCHVDAAVARLLDIVTSEDTQAARINLQSVAQAILHAEVGNRRKFLAVRLFHIFLEVGIDSVDLSHQLLVVAQFLEL